MAYQGYSSSYVPAAARSLTGHQDLHNYTHMHWQGSAASGSVSSGSIYSPHVSSPPPAGHGYRTESIQAAYIYSPVYTSHRSPGPRESMPLWSPDNNTAPLLPSRVESSSSRHRRSSRSRSRKRHEHHSEQHAPSPPLPPLPPPPAYNGPVPAVYNVEGEKQLGSTTVAPQYAKPSGSVVDEKATVRAQRSTASLKSHKSQRSAKIQQVPNLPSWPPVSHKPSEITWKKEVRGAKSVASFLDERNRPGTSPHNIWNLSVPAGADLHVHVYNFANPSEPEIKVEEKKKKKPFLLRSIWPKK